MKFENNPWFQHTMGACSYRETVAMFMLEARKGGRASICQPAGTCGHCGSPAWWRPTVGAVQCFSCRAVRAHDGEWRPTIQLQPDAPALFVVAYTLADGVTWFVTAPGETNAALFTLKQARQSATHHIRDVEEVVGVQIMSEGEYHRAMLAHEDIRPAV